MPLGSKVIDIIHYLYKQLIKACGNIETLEIVIHVIIAVKYGVAVFQMKMGLVWNVI